MTDSQRADFLKNFVSHVSSAGYRFAAPDDSLTPKPEEGALKAFITNPSLISALVFGPLFASSADSKSEPELYKDLKSLEQYCAFVAFKVQMGNVLVSVLVEADGKAEQELIGISSLLHAKFLEFKKYSTPIMRAWGFWEKLAPSVMDARSVWGQVYFFFGRSAEATRFSEYTAKLCKHKLGGVMTLPLTVDIPAQRIVKWSGWTLGGNSMDCFSMAELRERLFKT